MSADADRPGELLALMQRYVDGQPHAFDELYRLLAPRLRRFLVGLVGASGPVDDLLQTTVMRAHLARLRFVPLSDDPDVSVRAWYFTIARNAAHDYKRNVTRDPAAPEAQAALEVQLAASETPETVGLAEEAQALVIDRVHAALAELPAKQRELIELHKLDGMPFAEIATRLGAREGAVRVRAHRAYRALLRRLTSRTPEGGRS